MHSTIGKEKERAAEDEQHLAHLAKAVMIPTKIHAIRPF